MIYDIFIIGGGPGGLTAAIYGARAGFSVLIAEPGLPGGQMTLTHEIENYPGFPEGIDGLPWAKNFWLRRSVGARNRFGKRSSPFYRNTAPGRSAPTKGNTPPKP